MKNIIELRRKKSQNDWEETGDAEKTVHSSSAQFLTLYALQKDLSFCHLERDSSLFILQNLLRRQCLEFKAEGDVSRKG